MSEDQLGHVPAPKPPSDRFKEWSGPRLREQFEALRDPDSSLSKMLREVAKTVTRDDMLHTERFLMELYKVTPAEEKELAEYIKNPVGPPPIAYLKTMEPVAIDEKFYELAFKHDMFANEHRINMLMNVVEKQRLQELVEDKLEAEGE